MHAVESGKAAGQHVGEVLTIGRRLPVFAHRYERQILPHLLLQLGADAPLLVEISGIKPGSTQCLDLGARRPAVPAGLAVGTNGLVAEWIRVRDRAINQREKNVPAALCRRRLIGPPAYYGSEIHLLEVDVQTGAAELLGSDF